MSQLLFYPQRFLLKISNTSPQYTQSCIKIGICLFSWPYFTKNFCKVSKLYPAFKNYEEELFSNVLYTHNFSTKHSSLVSYIWSKLFKNIQFIRGYVCWLWSSVYTKHMMLGKLSLLLTLEKTERCLERAEM